MGVLAACLSMRHAPRGKKRVLEPLEMELWV